MHRSGAPSTWESYREAAGMFVRGVTVPTATRIALVVGTWLSLMNQSGAIFHGDPPWLKIGINYATPFFVASLGFLAARRRRNVERLLSLLQPPEAKGTTPPT